MKRILTALLIAVFSSSIAPAFAKSDELESKIDPEARALLERLINEQEEEVATKLASVRVIRNQIEQLDRELSDSKKTRNVSAVVMTASLALAGLIELKARSSDYPRSTLSRFAAITAVIISGVSGEAFVLSNEQIRRLRRKIADLKPTLEIMELELQKEQRKLENIKEFL